MTTTNTTRFEKVEWLRENTTETHIRDMFLTELVSWLGEDNFNEFFEYHCRVWNIETPEGDIDDR